VRVHGFGPLLVFSFLLLSNAACGAVYRVRAGATGTPHDGSTWDTAFTTVQAGINAASLNDEVWVAQGAYLERVTTKDGVALRGGYSGAGASPDARDWSLNVTIIDANFTGSVITVPANSWTGTIIDGFTIRNGTGTAPLGSSVYGGGVYCGTNSSPGIFNCIFSNNQASPANYPVGRGGAIYCDSASQPDIANNTFTGNSALYGGAIFLSKGTVRSNLFDTNSAVATGGAMDISNSGSTLVTGNTFRNCSASQYGGAIDCESATSIIMGNVFDTNSCISSGGAICEKSSIGRIVSNIFVGNTGYPGDAVFADGSIDIINNTFARQKSRITTLPDTGAVYLSSSGAVYNNIFLSNDAALGAPLYSSPTAGQFHNNCFFGNIADYVSPVPNVIGMNGNFNADPKVVDSANSNFHLRADSPCVDTGNPAKNLTSDLDVDGQARVFGPSIDIGADEFEPIMVFSTQPGNGHKGTVLAPQPAIALLDALGNSYFATFGSVSVALTPGVGTKGATLSGTTSLPFVNGLATFTNLRVDLGGAGYTLTATATNLAPIVSSKFNVVIPRVYVSTAGDDASEGSSWLNPKASIAASLAECDSPGKVWVRLGTYSANVTLPADVALLGGFRGRELFEDQRSPDQYVTVLSGLSAAPVVTVAAHASRSTLLDGFTITGGRGQLLGMRLDAYRAGGGIYMKTTSPTITHNIVIDNGATVGGGVCADGGSPLIQGNHIVHNTAACTARITGGGGGLAVIGGSTASILDNLIADNSGTGTNPLLAQGAMGGGIGCVAASPTLRNNTIASNTTSGAGGGLYLYNASPILTSNIVANNDMGLYAENNSQPLFRYNDFANNGAYNISGVVYPMGTAGNMASDPLFANATGGDYHISSKSPCLNAGDTAAVLALEQDLDGNSRVIGGAVDIGTYELTAYTATDAANALRIGAGLRTGATADMARLDVSPGAGDGKVSLEDAVRIARKVAGLEANP
jgi:parallel beta-helix repeat protein